MALSESRARFVEYAPVIIDALEKGYCVLARRGRIARAASRIQGRRSEFDRLFPVSGVTAVSAM